MKGTTYSPMQAEENKTPLSRIRWLSDLIRLEIILWERIDARLRAQHDLPLSYFESLFFIAQASQGSMRVGDLAQALGLTVGGTSKVVDRIERAGLIRRELDPADRRASRVVLTPAGLEAVSSASKTYEAEMAEMLDGALNSDEQHQMYHLVTRLLATIGQRASTVDEMTKTKK